MTPQEEQFLQAAKQGNKAYIEGQLNNVSSDMKIAAFVYTPSIEISQLLLKDGIFVNAYMEDKVSKTQNTALTYACITNNLEKVHYLIHEAGADLTKKSFPFQLSPLEIALKNRNTALVQEIAPFVEIDYHTKRFNEKIDSILYNLYMSREKGGEPIRSTKFDSFLASAKQGDLSRIQQFIEEGININGAPHCDKTALMFAIENGQNETAKYLVQHGAVVKTEGNAGIVCAAEVNSKNMIDWLLIHGANINDAGLNGRTALIVATQQNNLSLLNFLLEKGANVNSQDEGGNTSLMYASKKGNTQLVKQLLENNANPNLQNQQGNTALFNLEDEQIEITRLLIKFGLNPDLPNRAGETPLFIAAIHGQEKTVQLYLEHHANVNRQNSLGYTALMNAAQYNYYNIVQLLLHAGANVNLKNHKGQTALDLAQKYHASSSLINLLSTYGAKS